MKIPVGISSCLLGQPVRWNSGHKRHAYTNDILSQHFDFKEFCPEVAIGLGIPREPIHLVSHDNHNTLSAIRAVGTKSPNRDVTEQLIENASAQKAWQNELCGYIVKKDSPSCGMDRVKVYINGQPQRKGRGLYTRTLMDNFPNLPVEEEGRLEDPRLRENFMQRVFCYHRWRCLTENSITWKDLFDFHAQHKYMLMSHHQDRMRAIGHKLSQTSHRDVDVFKNEYIEEVMAILKIVATRKNHVNVLQHMQGYLKKHLDKADKHALSEVIEQYRLEQVPLIVPLTLFRHHFRVHPHQYIEKSIYFAPYPHDLKLLNQI